MTKKNREPKSYAETLADEADKHSNAKYRSEGYNPNNRGALWRNTFGNGPTSADYTGTYIDHEGNEHWVSMYDVPQNAKGTSPKFRIIMQPKRVASTNTMPTQEQQAIAEQKRAVARAKLLGRPPVVTAKPAPLEGDLLLKGESLPIRGLGYARPDTVIYDDPCADFDDDIPF